jgi:hypothetical protein
VGRPAEDDVGAAPGVGAVGAPGDGQRHRGHPSVLWPPGVEEGREAGAYLVGEGGVVEGVGVDVQQLLGPGQVGVHLGGGDEGDALAVARAGAGAGPVGAHAADVGGEGGGGQLGGAEQAGARSAGRARALGGALRAGAFAGVGDALDLGAGRVGQARTGVEQQNSGGGVVVVHLAYVGAAGGAAADDDEVVGGAEGRDMEGSGVRVRPR